MSLDVQFEIERKALLFQENPLARLTVINHFDDPVELHGPGPDSGNPVLRVVELKTGIELLKREHSHSPLREYWMLQPGKSTTYEFPLLQIAGTLAPAEYEISAIVPYQRGARQSESEPVKISIAPVTPRALHWTYVQGGWAVYSYAVSVNAASDPPQIVRHTFQIKSHAGVTDARVVAPASLRVEPVISQPPNKTVSHSHWIGWSQGGKVHFTHMDMVGEVLPPVAWEAGGADFELMAPLLEDASEESETRAQGHALVWQASGRQSWFQELQLSPGKPVVPRARFNAGGRPAWAQVHFKSTREKLVLFAIEEDGGVSLYVQNWQQSDPTAAPRKLGRWPGTCVGGGSLIRNDDEIRGGLVLRRRVEDGAPVMLHKWRLTADGKFAAADAIKIPWNYHAEPGQCKVRLAAGGSTLCVLLEEKNGPWKLFNDVGEPLEITPVLQQTRLPLDAGYYNEGNIVLIAGRLAQGFDIVMRDGSELPHR